MGTYSNCEGRPEVVAAQFQAQLMELPEKADVKDAVL